MFLGITIFEVIYINTIAQEMKKILTEQNRESVWFGDIDLIEQCYNNLYSKSIHPYNKIQYVLNALDRSQLYEKSYIISDISGYTRKYRCFKIKKS